METWHFIGGRKSFSTVLVGKFNRLIYSTKSVFKYFALFCLIGWLPPCPVARGQASDKMNVYFISGLGADQRVFQKLNIDPEFNPIPIEWIKPECKESMASYARRLSAQIDTTKPFQIVGLSFGGMIASEIADQINPRQIILISSKSASEPIGKFYRGLINFGLLSPFASMLMRSANSFTYKAFGAKTTEEKTMLRSILKDTDPKFMKWAVKTIAAWNHPLKSPVAYQINGSADRMIKADKTMYDYLVPGGEHLMVYTMASQISEILNERLKYGLQHSIPKSMTDETD